MQPRQPKLNITPMAGDEDMNENGNNHVFLSQKVIDNANGDI